MRRAPAVSRRGRRALRKWEPVRVLRPVTSQGEDGSLNVLFEETETQAIRLPGSFSGTEYTLDTVTVPVRDTRFRLRRSASYDGLLENWDRWLIVYGGLGYKMNGVRPSDVSPRSFLDVFVEYQGDAGPFPLLVREFVTYGGESISYGDMGVISYEKQVEG